MKKAAEMLEIYPMIPAITTIPGKEKDDMKRFTYLAHYPSDSAIIPNRYDIILLFIGIGTHVLLAYVLHSSPQLAIYYALAILVIGFWLILRDQYVGLIYLTGYIMGSEVLLRMVKADIFWESAKYSVVLLMLLAVLKRKLPLPGLPLLYFMLLLPSAVLTISDYSFEEARNMLSFNLSGPLLLCIAVLFFSQMHIGRGEIQRLLLYTMLPISGIAFLASYSTITAEYIVFTKSNLVTSGGFGPNQISAILGLGALLCWLYILIQQDHPKMRWVIIGLMVWFLTQTLLTFSRGGIVNFLVAASVGTVYLLRDRRQRIHSLMLGLILCGIFAYVIFPRIDEFTGGAFKNRFTNPDTTARVELFGADLEIWQENFLIGMGPGVATESRGINIGGRRRGIAAHTEFSRMLSEHGLLGFIALIILFTMFLRAFRQAPSPYAKGLSLAFMLWSVTEMSHSAMRIGAISYFFALPFVNFEDEN